jgi:hypothetical protein
MGDTCPRRRQRKDEQRHAIATGGVMKWQVPDFMVPFHPEYPLTVEEWAQAVDFLFRQVAGQIGSFEARRIFAQCAKPLTKRDRQLHENSELLWKYINMPKRSVRQLATRLAKEKNTDQRALEKKIARAVKNKKVRAYLEKILFEINGDDGPLLWTF